MARKLEQEGRSEHEWMLTGVMGVTLDTTPGMEPINSSSWRCKVCREGCSTRGDAEPAGGRCRGATNPPVVLGP